MEPVVFEQGIEGMALFLLTQILGVSQVISYPIEMLDTNGE